MNIHPILDRMYADRVIYCIQPWCARASKLTQAQLFIGLNGRPRMPACCDCATALQSAGPQPIELWYIDDDLRARWWENIDSAIGSPPPPQPAPPGPAPKRKPSGRQGWWILGLSVASIIAGIALIITGNQIDSSSLAAAQENAAYLAPSTQPFFAWGCILIALPFVMAILYAIMHAAIGTAKMTAEDARRYKTWKARLPPEDQRKVSWAETGAIWAGATAAHHCMREQHAKTSARLFASATGQAPLNNVHAGMRHATAILAQQKQQYQQQQHQPDSLQAPFTSTPMSDIHGNVTYRKRPWP